MRINTETLVGLFIVSAIGVFLFMSFKIGVWRLDTVRYVHYITYFSDVSGLNEKANVVIAGVKIGWVHKMSLVPRYRQVRIDLMIDRNSLLHTNAYGVIKQDGLLGTKYIEIFPGDPSLPILTPGNTLMKPSKPPVSIDDLLGSFKEIADNVKDITQSFKKAIGDEAGVSKINDLITNAQSAFNEIKETAYSLKSVINTNDQKLDTIFSNIERLSSQLESKIPNVMDSIERGVESFQSNITDISASFRKTIDPIAEAAEKIHSGKGIVGALINNEEMLKEVQTTVSGIKNYFQYMDRLGVDFDLHLESMHGRGNDLNFKDGKGVFNVLIRPSEDFYYLAGLVSSYAGHIKRKRIDTIWLDEKNKQIIPEEILPKDPSTQWPYLSFAPRTEIYTREYDTFSLNLQFCRNLGNLSFRLGLFESSFGLGIDYDIPLESSTKWMTTLESYRFYDFISHTSDGRMKFDVDRPHLKWINKVFFNDSMYVAFGADDFISRYNKNFFVGMGLSFENDDIKYIAPKINF